MREWRKSHSLTEWQRVKDRSRSYAGTYKRRGLIEQKECQTCGTEDSEMHHEDYSKPLDVIWLCRDCHLNLHRHNYQYPSEFWRRLKYWERIENK